MNANTTTRLSGALVLTFTVLAAGCVGTGPNTQRGAVGGAALGALAGAIIGNNSGSGNGLAGAAIGGAVGAVAGGTMGNTVDHQQGTIYGSAQEAQTDIVVQQAPPPPAPRVEVVTVRPGPSAVWIPGYWAYTRGGAYVWVGGRWTVPPPRRHHYHPAHWQRTPRGYVYVQGYWR